MDTIEYEGGQFALAVEVEHEGQQVIPEAVAPPIPAPLSFTPERPADDLRQALDADILTSEAPGSGCCPQGSRAHREGATGGTEPPSNPAPATPTKKPAREYRCAYCERKLKPGEWIYSSATGSRYCPPTDPHGCNTPRAYAKRERERERNRRARKEG